MSGPVVEGIVCKPKSEFCIVVVFPSPHHQLTPSPVDLSGSQPGSLLGSIREKNPFTMGEARFHGNLTSRYTNFAPQKAK